MLEADDDSTLSCDTVDNPSSLPDNIVPVFTFNVTGAANKTYRLTLPSRADGKEWFVYCNTNPSGQSPVWVRRGRGNSINNLQLTVGDPSIGISG